MDVKVVTYATDDNDRLKNWKLSAERFNYDYTVLGIGEKWSGWPQRTAAYLKFAKRQSPNQIVLLCDAYDVLFVDTPSKLARRFEEMGVDVVVSAEPRCCTGKMDTASYRSKFTNVCVQRAPRGNDFIYPCAGCVIGRAKGLSYLYEQILHSLFDTDDQSALDEIWTRKENILSLDYDSKLFGNVYISDINSEWAFDENKTLYRKKTGNYPCVLHFPGSKGFNVNYSVYNTVGKNIEDEHSEKFIPLKDSPSAKFNKWMVAILLFVLLVVWVICAFKVKKYKGLFITLISVNFVALVVYLLWITHKL